MLVAEPFPHTGARIICDTPVGVTTGTDFEPVGLIAAECVGVRPHTVCVPRRGWHFVGYARVAAAAQEIVASDVDPRVGEVGHGCPASALAVSVDRHRKGPGHVVAAHVYRI